MLNISQSRNETFPLLNQLDCVLEWLNIDDNHAKTHSLDAVVNGIVSVFGFEKDGLLINSVSSLLEKLIDDKYVIYKDIIRVHDYGSYPEKEYQITFKGRVWLEQNGYLGEQNRNSLAERRVQISQTLTWILAVGVTSTFVKDLFDVTRDYYNPILKPLVYIVVPFLYALFLVWLIYTVQKEARLARNKNK